MILGVPPTGLVFLIIVEPKQDHLAPQEINEDVQRDRDE